MKSLKFWKMQIRLLSLSEKMFYKDVIDTLLAWKVLEEECLELIILKRMLTSEMHVCSSTVRKEETRPVSAVNVLQCPGGNMRNFEKYLPGNRP
jgi:hypothetical protein